MAGDNKIFLFSIDLEDVREGVVNGHLYKDRVVVNTLKYLDWLNKNKSTCTFFTVGKIAERYPDLIKKIVKAGHEIACHSYNHTPIDKHTPDSFKEDLEKNINALMKNGAVAVKGFRAPVFSLTEKTSWAHKILAESGIKYSSSVLAANNPLYGWKGFGEEQKVVNGNIIEIPVTLCRLGTLTIPLAGGIYFRVLPSPVLMYKVKQHLKKKKVITSYFHPYDIDFEQEHFMHGGINNNSFYNRLMYYNRKNMFTRLDKITDLGLQIMTYEKYLNI